jgi:hypothetical protein
MIPAVWNYFVGYAVGTAIAVIGLYIAFVIPVYLRWRKGDSWDEPRAWTLGKHYKWIDPLSIVWVGLITIIFVIPLYKMGLRWEDGFDWRFTNYTILWFTGIGLIFGGWWALSAKNWFKGPVRMGTDEELEALRGGTRGSNGDGSRTRELVAARAEGHRRAGLAGPRARAGAAWRRHHERELQGRGRGRGLRPPNRRQGHRAARHRPLSRARRVRRRCSARDRPRRRRLRRARGLPRHALHRRKAHPT